MKKQIDLSQLNQVNFDVAAIKKQYDEHTSRCKQIAEEVNKWGRKTTPNLQFLKPKK
mgnify:CR=1 FL=1